jgi:hypothetical protein
MNLKATNGGKVIKRNLFSILHFFCDRSFSIKMELIKGQHSRISMKEIIMQLFHFIMELR